MGTISRILIIMSLFVVLISASSLAFLLDIETTEEKVSVFQNLPIEPIEDPFFYVSFEYEGTLNELITEDEFLEL